MKKLLFLLMVCCTLGATAQAQVVKEQKTKVKKTSTVGQKVHNTFSKHKHYSGHKAKSKVEKAKV